MKVAPITPYIFEGYLIISLDSKWIDVFGKIPTFEISIDKKKHLHLISKEMFKDDREPRV